MGMELSQMEVSEILQELQKLISKCEDLSQAKDNTNKQRLYEGMAIAFTTMMMRVTKEISQIDSNVIDEMYNAIEKTSKVHSIEHSSTCSFCQRNTEEVGELAVGPGVSICKECIEFGGELIKLNSTTS